MITEPLESAVARPELAVARPRPQPIPGLDRTWDLTQLNVEWLLYGLLFVASIGLHLWQLGHMAMAHDESVVSYMSWKFFTGRGPFTCAGSIPDANGVIAHTYSSQTYCYDPVYHGPTQYFLQFITYFLFGVSDWSSRLPMALSGIALIPACWLMRPLVGKRTALASAVLLTLSPSLLYYARYARHDALMVLWTMWMMVGLFRWLQSGKIGDLVLAGAGLALAWATHELVFILGFEIFTFFVYRALWEYRRSWFNIAVAVATILGVAVVAGTIATSPGAGTATASYKLMQRLLGPGLLLGGGGLLTLLLSGSWEATPVVLQRFRSTWASRPNADPDRPRTLLGNVPPAYLWAVAAFLIIFTLLFTTFFTYPVGFFDGLYRGLQYWLGSQHDYARGDQPWFYYFMLLPIYELLALLFTIGGAIALVWQRRARVPAPVADDAAFGQTTNGIARIYPAEHDSGNGHAAVVGDAVAVQPVAGDDAPVVQPVAVVESLFVPFTLYWGVLSFIAFTWAGEKMPWLLIHIATPLTLFAAAVIAGIIGRVPWSMVRARRGWAVPLLVLMLVVTVFIGAYFLGGADATLQGSRSQVKAIPALLVAVLAAFGLWNLTHSLGRATVLRLAALSVAGLLALYSLRSISLVVYDHPDTPVEPLIYTQTSPDVPVIVDRIQQMALDQTRNQRSKDDPTGGNTMKVVIDNELAWPFQWYFRDFRSLNWTDVTKTTTLPADAPVMLINTPHLNDNPTLKAQLGDTHVKVADAMFNWWFPEYGKVADPNHPGKEIRAYKELRNDRWWQVLIWPFNPSNWPSLARFMVYREIPQQIDGREFQMYVRTDLAPTPGGVAPKSAADIPAVTMTSPVKFGAGQLNSPRSVALDKSGNVYVADAQNHRIVVFDPSGKLLRTFGTKGAGAGQFFEPSGVAFDAAGNLYVADTWNARVVKLSSTGGFIKSWGSGTEDFGDGRRATDTKGDLTQNRAHPLNFYGPRNVLVIGDRLYIADTGNKRIVVTDLDGNFVEQFGSAGRDPGQFNEPIGLGKDGTGNLYVGDTWNGRVQVFSRGADQRINTTPAKTFTVRGWSRDTYNDPFLTVTNDGRTLVSAPERLEVDIYDANGALANRIRDPQAPAPHGLAIDANDQVFITEGGGTKGQVIGFKLAK